MTASKPPLSLNAWLRWDVVARMLGELDGVHSVLEVGPGLGGFAVRLARRYEYLGVDKDPTSLAAARARLQALGLGTVLLGEVAALEPKRRFDLVCAFEVLEHIDDDIGALREWASRLRNGGWLLLSVPAWQRRWGAHDHAAGHVRRYDREELASALGEAGLERVRLVTYGFPLGYLLQPAWDLLARRRPERSLEERTSESGRWFQPGEALAPLTRAVSFPFRLAQRPFAETDLGTGFVAVARRG